MHVNRENILIINHALHVWPVQDNINFKINPKAVRFQTKIKYIIFLHLKSILSNITGALNTRTSKQSYVITIRIIVKGVGQLVMTHVLKVILEHCVRVVMHMGSERVLSTQMMLSTYANNAHRNQNIFSSFWVSLYGSFY